MSQENLAEKLHSSQNYIALIEVGKSFPSPAMLERIAEALEIDSTQLFAKTHLEEDTLKKLRENLTADIRTVVDKRLAELNTNKA
jgi:transcriptional regulator with XRE-family HTH domain